MLGFKTDLELYSDYNYFIVVPVGEPLGCTNTTFQPRNTSLMWAPPIRSLQNGKIQGYYLNCTNGNGDTVPDTESTQASPNTTFTIPVLTPFATYTCRLSSINEIGEGPYTTCQFSTAQDSKLTVSAIKVVTNYIRS